jgi:formate-dependent nitrite reductase membrane component NrfD
VALVAVANHPLPVSPWGLPLAVYFTVIGVPSGVTLVAWWLRARVPPAADAIERRAAWIALVGLALVSAILVVDLGRPERFFLMLTRFSNLGSPIALGAKLIALKSALLVVCIYLLERRRTAHAAAPDMTMSRRAGARVEPAVTWSLLVASFALAIYPGIVLSRTWVSPLTQSGGADLLFLLTSLLMGASATMLLVVAAPTVTIVSQLGQQLRGMTVALLGLYGIALVFEGLTLSGGPAVQRQALADLLSGGLAPAFWGVVVSAGVALPVLFLTAVPPRRATSAAAAAAALTGACAARYLIFSIGQ